MTREEKETLLNDFLHQILVKKTVRIEQPLSSNTIAQAVIDYLDKVESEFVEEYPEDWEEVN